MKRRKKKEGEDQVISSGTWIDFPPNSEAKDVAQAGIQIPNPIDFKAIGHAFPLIGLAGIASFSDTMSWWCFRGIRGDWFSR